TALRSLSSSGLMESLVVQRFDDIIKSRLDTREYHGLVLANGLKVLLVSNRYASKAAAALSVQCGHLNDPWDVPGLAHFCEHMLFLGTEKYPEEHEYAKFVSENGGSSNAATSASSTNFLFDVSAETLESALDRFAQFFLSPKFTESATDKEVNAVDNEHSNYLRNDNKRFYQIHKNMAKPGHPYRKFATGNKHTLMVATHEKGIVVRHALLDFYQKHYSSNVMALVVVGRNSLTELEEMVCTLGFAEIENKNVTPDVYDQAYGPEECSRFVQVVPLKDTRTLSIRFLMPDLHSDYKSHPCGFLSNLLCHEGEGSLMSHLKKEGWISSIDAWGSTIAPGFGEFVVSIGLTLDGLERTDDILTEVFHAIALIRAAGPQEWIHEEMRKRRAINFEFKKEKLSRELAESAVSKLHHCPFKDILSSYDLLDSYDHARIVELTEYIRPSNMWYRIAAKEFESLPNLKVRERKEPIYGTLFIVSPIPSSIISRFEEAFSSTTSLSHLALPTPNPYIAERITLKAQCGDHSDHPTLLQDDRWARVWFKQDYYSNRPKAVIQLAITSPFVSLDPMSSVVTGITMDIFRDSLTEFSYNPELAGLLYDVEVTTSGVDITVHGFDEHLPLFLHDILDKLAKFKPGG
ncbi:hypothetical protein PMAYCL1PPCAC_22482, partial [Pristionchus mayeri]